MPLDSIGESDLVTGVTVAAIVEALDGFDVGAFSELDVGCHVLNSLLCVVVGLALWGKFYLVRQLEDNALECIG